MSTRRPRRKPGENRARLLKAGLIEFGLFGYHGTSTASVAARAEVPQPHVYANFETKQTLFLACVHEAIICVKDAHTGHLDAQRCESSVGAEALVFQAVAAARDQTLEPQISALLQTLRTDLGEHAVNDLLRRAWQFLAGPWAEAEHVKEPYEAN